MAAVGKIQTGLGSVPSARSKNLIDSGHDGRSAFGMRLWRNGAGNTASHRRP
jgi:hypothetical protein